MFHCNEHKFSTEQFITEKISGNAFKQGSSRTHSVLHQHTLQLQKYKAARMSRRIVVSRSEGMRLRWRTPRVDGLKLVNYTRKETAHKIARKFSFLLCGCCT